MKRQDVENTITEYLKPIFGFALKRCKSIHDAEDLSQEIVLKAFRALLAKEDVADMGKFIWTVAHNTLSNYYRDTVKSMIGVSIDEVSELIADDLGVSPVYVETEVEFLEEYGFLQVDKDKYIVNFIISEPTAELLTMQNEMYKRAAELFANDLYDELISCGVLDDPDIWCGQTDEPISLTHSPKADRNFILWSLIPYIAAWSGEKLMDEKISFEEVATIRPDGALNIYHASVVPVEMVLPQDYVYMRNWCGPMWNKVDHQMMWQIDSEWSDRAPVKERNIAEEQKRTLALYNAENEDVLPKHDYAWLAECGYVKTNGDYDGHFKSAWQIVTLASGEIRDKLLAIGERIKEKYKRDFDTLKAPYSEAVLESVPAHLKKIKAYELQFVFHADGWFLLHCIVTLLNNGKLKLPTQEQRKALTTLIVNV